MIRRSSSMRSCVGAAQHAGSADTEREGAAALQPRFSLPEPRRPDQSARDVRTPEAAGWQRAQAGADPGAHEHRHRPGPRPGRLPRRGRGLYRRARACEQSSDRRERCRPISIAAKVSTGRTTRAGPRAISRRRSHCLSSSHHGRAMAGAVRTGPAGAVRPSRRGGLHAFCEAISEIESVRAELQPETSLKTEFLADKRDVYDALLEILLERGMPRRFSKCWNERGRGRSRIAWRWHSRRSPRSSRGSSGSRPSRILGRAAQRGGALGDRDASGIASLPAVVTDLGEISSLLNEASAARPTGGSCRRPRSERGCSAESQCSAADVTHLIVVPTESWRNSLRAAGRGHRLTDRRAVRPLLPTLRRVLLPIPPAPRVSGTALEAPTGLIRRSPDPAGVAGRGDGTRRRGAEQPASRLGRGGPRHRPHLPRPRQLFSGTRISRDTVGGCCDRRAAAAPCDHAVADMTSAERSRILFSPDREQDGRTICS